MDDTQEIFQISKEDSLGRFLPDQVYRDYDEASKALEFLMRSSEEINIEREPYVLGVILNGNELIGHVGASKIEEGVEIGYAIEKKHQGLGYAQKAVSQMLHLLEVNTNVREVYGIVDPENEASKKVLERSVVPGVIPDGRDPDRTPVVEVWYHADVVGACGWQPEDQSGPRTCPCS